MPSYNFTWSNGAFGDTLVGLKAGEYVVTVSDTLGCAYVDTIEVFQPTVISPSLTVKDSVLCYGDSTGALSVFASGGTWLQL